MKSRARQNKRTTFSKILIKRILISSLVYVLLMVIVFIYGMSGIYTMLETEYYIYENNTARVIENQYLNILLDGKDFNDDTVKKQFATNVSRYFERLNATSVKLYDSTTKEIIAETHDALCLYEKTADGEGLWYECNMEDVIELKEYYDILYAKHEDEIYSETLDYNIKIDILDIYIVDANRFIPGKVNLNLLKNGMILESKEFDFTSDAHIDMQHKDMDTAFTIAFFINDYSTEKTEKMIRDTLNEYDGSVYMINSGYGEQDLFSINISSVTPIETGGQEMFLVMAMNDNLFDIVIELITWKVIIECFIIVILIATVLALLKWTKLKAQYDMEDYRRGMTGAMAHDLKSPLMAISGYAENLKNNIHTEKRSHYAEAISQNVTYMNSIIENVLELSKIEAYHSQINATKFDVNELLEEVIKKYELQIKERKLTLDIEGQMILEAERNMMVQAMDNLIGNAVKYCRDEGVIRITLNEKNIVISNPFKEKIGDNVKLSNLCKPFVMGDNSRGNKKGTGIGLAIVKNIIDIHRFSLKLECEDDIFSVIISVGKHKKG